MTWGIDQVNLIFLFVAWVDPLDRAVLGSDCNTAFTLEVTRVHDEAVLTTGELIKVLSPEHAGLVKKAVGQGSFAMVDVSNDCDVAEMHL